MAGDRAFQTVEAIEASSHAFRCPCAVGHKVSPIAVIRQLGITAGQGYLLGRPARERRVDRLSLDALMPKEPMEPITSVEPIQQIEPAEHLGEPAA